MEPKPATDGKGERRNWRWREWYAIYLQEGRFPDAFGIALTELFNSIRRLYPDEKYGPWQGPDGEERINELLCRVLEAIVRSSKLDDHIRGGWNDRQIYGYFRRVMENEIRKMRAERFPAWFWMMDRLRGLEGSFLVIGDRRRQFYIPAAWINGEQYECLDDAELEARLGNIPPISRALSKHISDSAIIEIVETAFRSAGSAIPLDKLVRHTLRVLGIGDLSLVPLEQQLEGEDSSYVKEEKAEKGADPTLVLELKEWLRSILSSLNVDHLLVLKCHVCEGLSFQETARRVSAILNRERFGLETARQRYLEVVRLLGSTPSRKYDKGFLPSTEDEENAFRHLLSEAVEKRLNMVGISQGLTTYVHSHIVCSSDTLSPSEGVGGHEQSNKQRQFGGVRFRGRTDSF